MSGPYRLVRWQCPKCGRQMETRTLAAAAPCVPCSNGRHSICWGDLNAVCPCPACAEWAKRSPFGRPPNDEEVDR